MVSAGGTTAKRGKALVVEDDALSRRLLNTLLTEDGLVVEEVDRGVEALARIQKGSFDVVLLDLRLPDLGGLSLLERLGDQAGRVPIIVLTGDSDPKSAVRAIRLGAFDYLTKPIDIDQLNVTIERALDRRALSLEVERLRLQIGDGDGLLSKMGRSPVMKRLLEQVRVVAESNFTVLISGETGCGKELVAQAIHRISPRRDGPLVAIDCGAIAESLVESELFGHERGAFTGADRRREGRFELAAGGTLFLDEIANLPLALQAKLLRVIESRLVHRVGGQEALATDVRIVAATNVDLSEKVQSGEFRSDLYFRLAEFTVRVSPLRERIEDIPYLALRFAEEAGLELHRPIHGLTPDAIELLQRHAWSGNVRELRNVIRRAVLVSSAWLLTRDLLESIVGQSGEVQRSSAGAPTVLGGSLREIGEAAVRDAEIAAIRATLQGVAGNISQAAKLLQTDYKTLHTKIKRYGIRAKDFASE